MLSCQRHLFSLPEKGHYLNCAYMSPNLKSVELAGLENMRLKNDPSQISPEDFFKSADVLRGLVARLVNASPEQVAFIPSVSYGGALAGNNISPRRGQNVVLVGGEFPSNVYQWRDQCSQSGAELRQVPRPADSQQTGEEWNEAILAAIDQNTALVTLTAVHWTDGTVFDLERIGAKARKEGALFILDGTQSVGARPFDFQAIQPDMLICAGYKWCLGPYGYGFAVLGEAMLKGQPLERAWQHREGCEDFSRLIHYTDRMRNGGRRFDAGGHSNFIMVPMLSAAIKQILDWGVENIEFYCKGLVSEISRALENTEFAMAPTGEQASHLFGIHIPDEKRAPAVLEEIRRREIHVSLRGDSIRISPHLYNRSDDMAALAEALLAAGNHSRAGCKNHSPSGCKNHS